MLLDPYPYHTLLDDYIPLRSNRINTGFPVMYSTGPPMYMNHEDCTVWQR